jgi:hypothetical protein
MIRSAAELSTQNPNAFPLTFHCGNQQVTIVSPSGPASSGLVTTDNRVFLVTFLTAVGSFTDLTTNQPVTQTSTFQFGAGHGQANGIGNLTSCVSEPFTVQDLQLGTGTVTLTLVGFFAPH